MHMMVDLETASDQPDAVISAIGVAVFDAPNSSRPGQIYSELYLRVDGETHQNLGGHVSFDTFRWWLGQSDDARREIREGKTHIEEALAKLTEIVREYRVSEVWGNGADFDCVILQSAYRHARMKCPFEFRQHRCFRTLKALYPDVTELSVAHRYPSVVRVKHHALHDARWQAYRAIEMLSRGVIA